MNGGSGLVEAWIPDGGFEIQRRKAKTSDGGAMVTDCLVAKWSGDDLTVDHPLHRPPCLHRVLATCRHDQIVKMANNYGLLTVTVARKPEPGKPAHADLLAPEPVEAWHCEIRALRAITDLWDSGKDGELVARRITERLARTAFHLTARPDGGGKIVLRYRPVFLIDAIWQQFAREVAGVIQCTKCPAPNCGRWFLRSVGRADRQYCSATCRMRAWRSATFNTPAGSP
ncbi:MAG: hypothetical protein ACM3UP_02570 [Methanocella sp.]